MIKSVLAILGAVCALMPSVACIRPANAEQAACETRYCMDFQGGQLDHDTTRKVYYSSREIDYYENPYKLPRFCATMDQSCVTTASGVAIIYYDRLYDNLVPNYAAKYIGSRYSYGTQNDVINNLFSTLYTLMGTTSQGATIAGFKSGTTVYINQQGYSVDLVRTTGSYYNTNIDYLKQLLRQEKVGVIFLHNFSVVSPAAISTGLGYDSIPHKIYNGDHAMAVYGYYDYYYYDESGKLVTRDTYLCVQTGVPNTLEFLYINDFCEVDDIYIMNIY